MDFLGPIKFDSPNGGTSNSRIKKNVNSPFKTDVPKMLSACYQPECIFLARASSKTWSKTFYRTEGRPDRRPKGQRPVVTCSLSISRLSQPHSPIASWMAYSRLYFRAREFCRYCRFGTHSSYAHDYLRIL